MSNVELVRAPALTDTAPYAYAAVAHGLVFTAGADPLDADGRVVSPGNVTAQTVVIMDNLEVALGAAGCTLSDVVKSSWPRSRSSLLGPDPNDAPMGTRNWVSPSVTW